MRRLLAVLVLPLLLLTACGGSGGKGSPSASPSGSDLSRVTVTGDPGTKPTVTFKTPFSTDKTTRKVVTEGSGAAVEAGQSLKIDYLGVNGRTGKEFDTSYGKKPVAFTLDEGVIIKGFLDGVVGTHVGSRVLVAVAPQDGYGPQGGVEAAGIKAGDTILFVIDVLGVVPQRATGEPVPPQPGLPTVTLAENGKPTITIPQAEPPKELLVQQLIKGTGPAVATGQTVTVQYTGVKWADGKQFDSSWDKGMPAHFEIGMGKVIPAWDIALVGQPVGSQVLIVVPPDKGYGTAGNPQAGISGTDTLVFVVDILDAA
ncbi:MAG: FKBP-type peptidyl-prolyl cis-trans isomerase [Actinomycetes bacterium]